MTTGSAQDIQSRVLRVLPRKWFRSGAKVRNAIIGGCADGASWLYGFIQYAKAQTRLASANGIWLDIFAYDFLGRTLTRSGNVDDVLRRNIKVSVLQERVTRAGVSNAVQSLTGVAPTIFEPWNTGDTCAASNPALGIICGQGGYGVGAQGYGNMRMPAQALLTAHVGVGAGVPNVGGYGSSVSGYGAGAQEYVGPSAEQSGITNQMVYDAINRSRPTGVVVWTKILP